MIKYISFKFIILNKWLSAENDYYGNNDEEYIEYLFPSLYILNKYINSFLLKFKLKKNILF